MTSTLSIIQELRSHAEEVWLHTNTADMSKDGDYKYTAYQIAQENKCTFPDRDENQITVKADDFKCSFPESHIFRILAKFESMARLSSKRKTTFVVKVKDGQPTNRYVGCPDLPTSTPTITTAYLGGRFIFQFFFN